MAARPPYARAPQTRAAAGGKTPKDAGGGKQTEHTHVTLDHVKGDATAGVTPSDWEQRQALGGQASKVDKIAANSPLPIQNCKLDLGTQQLPASCWILCVESFVSVLIRFLIGRFQAWRTRRRSQSRRRSLETSTTCSRECPSLPLSRRARHGCCVLHAMVV